MEREAAQLHALFRGSENAYGTFKLGKQQENGKLAGIAKTVRGPVTDELWLKHLRGEIGLGIIPIDENNRCRWGCIDIDDYPPRTTQLLDLIERHKFPLIACFSKSGGLHLFLFLKKPLLAKDVQECLQSMASVLALGDKEIFPKQTIKGAVGNWLNMPYFGQTRQCVTGTGQLSLAQFLDYIRPIDKLPRTIATHTSRFPDGPPCLQAIAEFGPVNEHEKHDALFALGTYFKMADREQWASQLRMANSDTSLLPAGHSGIEGIVEDLTRTDYAYRCNNPPIKKFCNRALCMTRKFGVTKGACMPVSYIAYSDGQTTTTFVTVWSKGKVHTIRVTTEEWLDPRKFRKACYDQIQDRPPSMKETDWSNLIDTLPITVMQTADLFLDTVLENLQKYCAKYKTTERKDLLVNDKKAFFDHRKGRVYFKATVIAKLLDVSVPTLEQLIRQNGGNNAEQLNLGNNYNRRFSWLPFESALPELPLPELDEDPI